jgi:nucleotide-binding universal stress UspA family protein
MKTIICPTDFTAPSNNAITYAMEMAKKLKLGITLVHAYEIPIVYSDMALASMYIPPAEIKNESEEQLLKFRTALQLKYPDIEIEAMLLPGMASEKITQAANEKKATFIIMSSTSTSALERALVGSNTSRVINDAPCPLIIVPPSAKFNGIKNIIFTTNLENENLDAATKVASIAKLLNASVMFLYVNTHLLEDNHPEVNSMTEKIKQHVSYNNISGYVCNDTDIVKGIEYFLSKYPADLFCMITHHRGVFERLWHPSITKKVAGHLSSPMLVLR